MTETTTTPCMVILTTELAQDILAQGGTQHWRISAWRGEQMPYVVCVRNGHHEWSPTEGGAHGEAFMIGKVSRLVPSGEPDRVKVVMSEWAPLSIKDCWLGDRYPVRYRTLEDLGVDLAALDFQPIPVGLVIEEGESGSSGLSSVLAAAKSEIAGRLGLPASMVEITIRA